ncbi:MAG: hypothetical protein KDA24_19190 [Deltaproteobacteria bacterium]|nr:hypothetical protein [Deltaproteobacteria bacterium]
MLSSRYFTLLSLLSLLLLLVASACTPLRGGRGWSGGGDDDDDSASNDDDATGDDDDATGDDDDATSDDDDATGDDDDATSSGTLCPTGSLQLFSETEPNDTQATAQALSILLPGTCLSGTTSCGAGAYDDEDWFTATSPVSLPVTTELIWDQSADMDFVLTDSAGNTVINYQEVVGTSESASATLPAGDYTGYIGCWEGSATEWALFINFAP